jgi:sortase A
MSTHPIRRVLSYLLIAGGALLLIWGVRDVWESRAGQSDAAREFQEENAQQAPPPVTPASRAPAPQRGEPLAELVIPRLDTELYVVEGDGARELRRGPGHLPGTAMPGAKGNCVIAGHRDTHFRILKDLKEGDDLILRTRMGQYLYRVQKLTVVSPSNTASLQPTQDAELNLITCYPFYYVGSAPKRFVVEARLAGAINQQAAL